MDWSDEELRELKRTAAKYPRSLEKNERWRLISRELGRGKRDCYAKYKELKNDKKRATNQRGKGLERERDSGDERPQVEQDEFVEEVEEEAQEGDEIQEIDYAFEAPDESECKEEKDLMMEDVALSPGLEQAEFFSSTPRALHWQSKEEKSSNSITVAKDNVPQEQKSETRESRMITVSEAREVKRLLFAREKRELDAAWSKQGFFFTKQESLRYGLVQLKGGPCGVIAAVQAFILRALLFDESADQQHWENPTAQEQNRALCDALAEVIWQACEQTDGGRDDEERAAVVCIQESGGMGRIDKLRLHYAKSKGGVRKLIKEHLKLFQEKTGAGVTMLLCSTILTRGIERVRGDIDSCMGNEVPLIGNHNYASQELVNLFLLGYASSNVFDGERSFGAEAKGDVAEEMVLKGIRRRGKVGFLTLFEHYGYMEVGESLKTPACPVFVICSESHYSVLFSVSPRCLEVSKGDEFDLFYYDELGNQDEVYKLSVVASDSCSDSSTALDGKKELVSPIEHCIRTKWKGASVDWNGSEPLL